MTATKKVAQDATERLRRRIGTALCIKQIEPIREKKSWKVRVTTTSPPPPGLVPVTIDQFPVTICLTD